MHKSAGGVKNPSMKNQKPLPTKKPIVVHQTGRSIFNFPNGDIYIGSYVLSPDSLVRSGHGMYICKDKTIFIGEWEDNKMVYGRIRFPNNVEYIGNLTNHLFHNRGTYKIPGKGRLTCSFHMHCPLGQMSLVDEEEHTWRGEVGRSGVTLSPTNHFLESPLSDGNMESPPRESHTQRSPPLPKP